jgi:hypothetical protein
MKKALVISLCAVCLLSGALLAGNNPDAKVAVHVRAHNAKAGCNYGTIETCDDIVYEIADADVDAFPVFFGLTEYLGCEYALTWPAWTYSALFTSCSEFVIGGITWPGDWASHTWSECRTGVCVPSYAWLYADGPGQVCVIEREFTGVIKVLDCEEGIDTIDEDSRACAGIYGAGGDDPCDLNPTTPTTWGEIKALFE